MFVPCITVPSIASRVTMWPFIGTATCQLISTGPALAIWKSVTRLGTCPQLLVVVLLHAGTVATVRMFGKPAGPCGPVAPAAPVAPVAPFGPAAPVGPAAPAGPVAPATPWEPVGPVGPGAPCGPAGPGLPVGPGLPAGPAEPAGPSGPRLPCGPTGPIGPGAPTSFQEIGTSELRHLPPKFGLITRSSPV